MSLKSQHRIIIDADTGIDDALAILYAVRNKEIKLEGVTTVFGNTDVEQATENTLRLIGIANCDYDIPVVKGASAPLIREWHGVFADVHGANGIGGAELPVASQKELEESATDFIIRKVNENPGEITLVAIGRLTNVALAIQKDPSIVSKCKKVVIMGGNVFAPGNITPVAEANFWGDPEAAAILFESELPLVIVGLDVTMQTMLTQDHLDTILAGSSIDRQKINDFLKSSLGCYFNFYEKTNGLINACPMHDPLAVLVAVDPTLVKTKSLHAVIAHGDDITDGMVVLDRRAFPSVGRPIDFCLKVDANRAITMLIKALL